MPGQSDYGATGPAARARPSQLIEIAGESTGSASPGRRIEVRRYGDATLADRMHAAAQLSDRQHAAAVRLLALFDAAALAPVVTGRYAPRGWFDGHDDDAPEAPPLTALRALLARYDGQRALLLHRLCLGEHPGVRWLATLQESLAALADGWGIGD